MVVLLLFLIVGIIGILCLCKREDSYWDWLANYNMPKSKKDKEVMK
jgi:hypothetical protein